MINPLLLSVVEQLAVPAAEALLKAEAKGLESLSKSHPSFAFIVSDLEALTAKIEAALLARIPAAPAA